MIGIILANSWSKAKICVDLLIELGCTKIDYTMYEGNIPVSRVIFFTPTEELKLYLKEMMYLRNKIRMDEEEIR